MKILYIHTKYLQSAGGEDTVLSAEMELMRSRGHEVEVLLFDNASISKGLAGKLIAGVSSVYNASSARILRQKMKIFRPEIIHVHNLFFTASPSVLFEAKKSKVPVVVTIHNFRLICANALLLRNNKICELCVHHDFPWYGVFYKCYHHSSVQSAAVGGMSAIHKQIGTWKNKVDIFLTPAEFIRTKLLNSSFNAPPEKMRVKRNFTADPDIGKVEDREQFYLFVGRLSKEKGINVLLEAWENLQNEKLLIAGDGPDREELVSRYGHLDNVSFLGKKTKDEVLNLMKKCKALIFPSIWYEGLPLTLVESFATGTPVIASALGAMQEMIQDRQNGILFEHGNPVQLKKAVLLFDEYLQKGDYSLYANARKSYQDHYHPDKCYNAVMEIYNDVIRKNNA